MNINCRGKRQIISLEFPLRARIGVRLHRRRRVRRLRRKTRRPSGHGGGGVVLAVTTIMYIPRRTSAKDARRLGGVDGGRACEIFPVTAPARPSPRRVGRATLGSREPRCRRRAAGTRTCVRDDDGDGRGGGGGGRRRRVSLPATKTSYRPAGWLLGRGGTGGLFAYHHFIIRVQCYVFGIQTQMMSIVSLLIVLSFLINYCIVKVPEMDRNVIYIRLERQIRNNFFFFLRGTLIVRIVLL